MTHHSRRTRPLLIALLLASGSLAGCERDSDSQTAVRNAGHKFGSISPELSGHSASVYEEIIRSVSSHAGSGDGYAEAAAVTLAQARLGQATQAAQEAARAEAESIRRIRVIRGSLSEYITAAAVAEAATRFNAQNDLTELDGLLASRRQDQSTYERQKAEIDAQIADLDARIAELKTKAQTERARAGELGLQMSGVNAQRAAELAAEIREHTLRGDQFDLEAQRIEGRVGQLRPSAAEIGMNVEKAKSQIAQLLNAQRELQARGRAAQTDAAESRAAAAQARDRLADKARELIAFREAEVAAKNDRVVSLLSQSQTALRDARDVVQASAAVTRASIGEITGSVWARRAAGQTEAAAIFEALAAAGIPGPMAQTAQSERNAAAESATNSTNAYRAAAEALRSVRARGDASDKLRAAAERLDRLAGIEPEPVPQSGNESGNDMGDDDTWDESTTPATPDLSSMSLEDIAAMLPESMRGMVMAQFQAYMDMLAEETDPEVLRQLLTQLDQQAAMMPAEMAQGIDLVKREIQRRIDELEGGN